MQARQKCTTARIWTYVRDERPWDGDDPPAAWYRFNTDREGKHPADHLKAFKGWMRGWLFWVNQLYKVEKDTHGKPPEERGRLRQKEAKPFFDDPKDLAGSSAPPHLRKIRAR